GRPAGDGGRRNGQAGRATGGGAADGVMNLVSKPPRFRNVSKPALSTDFEYASSGATTLFLTSSNRLSFSVIMPSALPTCIIDGIWNVLPSRIRLLTALLTMSTSSAAARPPPILRQSVCAMTP